VHRDRRRALRLRRPRARHAALRHRSDDVDARGATAIPGFVDSHTHIPFAGFRESEFNRRLQGETYEQIAASGGGIASSVHATRAASEELLAGNVLDRARMMARHGTTTSEAKSGYGLNLEDELKQLRAIRTRGDVARAARPDLPRRARLSAGAPRRSDVGRRDRRTRSCPRWRTKSWPRSATSSSSAASSRATKASACCAPATKLGMIPRLHADELSDTHGASLAAELGAASADHLMHISDRGIAPSRDPDTVANLLPATSFFLMSDRYAPARRLIDAGAIVSLSTDCNPGSSMTESMQMVMQLATLQMKMTVEESLTAATLNGAYSLRFLLRRAVETSAARSKWASAPTLVSLDAPNYLHLTSITSG
jgi:imidazolonepropionase